MMDSFNSRQLLIVEWVYVAFVLVTFAYWAANVCMTRIARRVVTDIPMSDLIGRNCSANKASGREVLGPLLKFTDEFLRDHQHDVNTTDLERLLIAWSVAHLVRDGNFNNPEFRRVFSLCSRNDLVELRAKMKQFISVATVKSILGSQQVTYIQIYCIVIRLRQDCGEILRLLIDPPLSKVAMAT